MGTGVAEFIICNLKWVWFFMVGTMIESPLDFFTGGLTTKERTAFADEMLSDRTLGEYR
ncbi:hypothetical protein PanWU01x14_155710 [Parasponia andersonii]|uniref:Uncharacterized protein n=1 Tax=Parasponia andersonii TaxID=3476 RepID=A0A2P5CG88_PARAD|nr:hypothetical protein PanWU01x14_155710 [Parasponia andersonii]